MHRHILLYLPSIFFFFFISICFYHTLYTNATFNPAAKPIISFCGGQFHNCVVFNSQQMKCLGSGSCYGSQSDYGKTPITVGDAIPYFSPGTSLSITKVSCSNNGICVLLNSGDIKCVGGNGNGQAGIGVTTNPIVGPTYFSDSLPIVSLGNGVKVTSLAGGDSHYCVLTTDAKVKCFGRNDYGQLGAGDNSDKGKLSSDMGESLPFLDLGTNVEVASLHSGSAAQHNCVILSKPVGSEQRVKCWGWNTTNQLGYGTTFGTNNRGDAGGEMGDNLPLVDLGSELRVKQMILAQINTCALLVNDMLKCWGGGSLGRVASGSGGTITSTGDSLPFIQVDSGKTVKLATLGVFHICAVLNDMITVKCAGAGNFGQLGQGDSNIRGATPETTFPFIPAIQLGTGSLQIASIYTGWYFNCIIFEDYTIKCFGDNVSGQAAIGSSTLIGDGPGEMGSNLEFAEIIAPTKSPTKSPSTSPSRSPSNSPTLSPTSSPTNSPTVSPTKSPTASPTKSPSRSPSISPTSVPTSSPTSSPTKLPTTNPTKSPSRSPTKSPTKSPSKSPSKTPTISPSTSPTVTPTKLPSHNPSKTPTNTPTSRPTFSPTRTCDYGSAKLCVYDPKCMWTKSDGVKRCVVFDCTVLNKGKCKKQRSRCKWNKPLKLICNPKNPA